MPRAKRYLHNRWMDFLTLGGGSLIVMAAVAALIPRTDEARVALAGTMLFMCHLINHPHFAFSYQIFYRGFIRHALSRQSPLRLRYLIAGVGVPAAIVVFFAIALAKGSAPLLGLAANVMFFTVGWHYAKQGYGILMVDAVQSRTKFDSGERRRLLRNTHLTWFTYWLVTNDALAAHDFWGLTYLMFDTPDTLLVSLLAAVTVSTLVVARDFVRRWRAGGGVPVNGLIAYVAAVYIWLPIGLVEPLLALIVPLFHSLQYISVVWRYQLNVESDKHRESPVDAGFRWGWLREARAGLARFLLAGGLLGALGFWWAPEFLDAAVAYDRAIFGATAFLFMGWTFINIHHYFLDSVTWRRENPETLKHLFSVQPRGT